MKTYLPVIGVLGAGFALLVLALPLAGAHPLLAAVVFAVGTVVGLLGEGLVRQRPAVARALEGFGAGLTVRTGLRGLLLGGLAVAGFAADQGTVILVALTLVLVWSSRLALQVLVSDAVAHRLSPVSWRNLDVPGVVRQPPLAPALLGEGQRWVSVATLAMVAGLVVPLAGGPDTAVPVAAAVAAVICVLFVALALADALRARQRHPPREDRRPARRGPACPRPGGAVLLQPPRGDRLHRQRVDADAGARRPARGRPGPRAVERTARGHRLPARRHGHPRRRPRTGGAALGADRPLPVQRRHQQPPPAPARHRRRVRRPRRQ